MKWFTTLIYVTKSNELFDSGIVCNFQHFHPFATHRFLFSRKNILAFVVKSNNWKISISYHILPHTHTLRGKRNKIQREKFQRPTNIECEAFIVNDKWNISSWSVFVWCGLTLWSNYLFKPQNTVLLTTPAHSTHCSATTAAAAATVCFWLN